MVVDSCWEETEFGVCDEDEEEDEEGECCELDASAYLNVEKREVLDVDCALGRGMRVDLPYAWAP